MVFLCAAELFVRRAAAGVFVRRAVECSFVELRRLLSLSCCRTFVELRRVLSSSCCRTYVELLSGVFFRRAAVGVFFRRAAVGVFVHRAEGVFVLRPWSFVELLSAWLLYSFRSQSLRRGYLRDITHENDLQEGFEANFGSTG